MERKITAILVLFMAMLMPLSAQMSKCPVDSLEYAHFEADTLAFDMQTSKLVPFFQKFDEVVNSGEGNVNILHLGSSHVQAGTLSHTIRRNLLLSYPHLIARRGMIFP